MAGNGIYIAGEKIGNPNPTYQLVEDTEVEVTAIEIKSTTTQPVSTTSVTVTPTGLYSISLLLAMTSNVAVADDLNFTNKTSVTKSDVLNGTLTIENPQIFYVENGTLYTTSQYVIGIDSQITNGLVSNKIAFYIRPANFTDNTRTIGFTGFMKLNGKYLLFSSTGADTDFGQAPSLGGTSYTITNIPLYGTTTTGNIPSPTTTTEVVSTLTNGSSLSSYSSSSNTATTTDSEGYSYFNGIIVTEITTTKVEDYANGSYTYRLSANYYDQTSYTKTTATTRKSRRIIEV